MVHVDSLVSIRAESCVLIIHRAVYIRGVVEGTIASSNWPSPSLVHEVPVEAAVWSMLSALVLLKQLTLLNTELLQIPGSARQSHYQ